MASTLFSDADRTSILDLKAGFMSNYRGSGDHLRRNRALEWNVIPLVLGAGLAGLLYRLIA